MNQVKVDRLKEHHKNGHYFTDIEGEKYNEIRRSIEEYGIRDPIKVFQVQGEQGYTVISGHQRLRIARDIGMNTVPVEVVPDLNEQEAEYLLIAENVERRGQAESDPIKKSRIANFLKEYWGIKNGVGRNLGQNGLGDIGEAIGESERSTKRILKLNSLIPQLQSLVSQGKLGTTAGEQLAYLTPEVQSALYESLGEDIANKTVQETKDLRKEVNGKEIDEIKSQLEEQNRNLANEIRFLKEQAKNLSEQKVETIVQEVEIIKEVVDPNLSSENDYLKEQLEAFKSHQESLEEQIKRRDEELEEFRQLRDDIAYASSSNGSFGRGLNTAIELGQLEGKLNSFARDVISQFKYNVSLNELNNENNLKESLFEVLDKYYDWIVEDMPNDFGYKRHRNTKTLKTSDSKNIQYIEGELL